MIDRLRRAYPGVTWSFSREIGSRWTASDGRVVEARSACHFSPGGSESYRVVYLWASSGLPVSFLGAPGDAVMSPTGTTLPATGIGVWEGARVFVWGRPGIVVGGVRDTAYVWLVPTTIQPAAMILPAAAALTLDLTHRMTRLEVMARLGARVGADVSEGVLWFRMFARRTWMLDGNGGQPGTWSPTEDGDASILPALADLDPTDDTRTNDGALEVDIKALAIVAAQVFTPPA